MSKFLVIKDTREKNGSWDFPASETCLGTTLHTLKTGDYTLKGHEESLCIERKASVSEIAANLLEDRFEREMVRMAAFKWPHLILDFSYSDILLYPNTPNSGVPLSKRPYIKIRGSFIMKKLVSITRRHGIWLWFADNRGDELALTIFKEIAFNE